MATHTLLTRPLATGWFLTAVVTAFAVCGVVAVLLPHDPYVRYQSLNGTMFERASWIYERIHFDPTPIDVAFIGSSRTARGAVPSLIEPELRRRGAARKVVNFSLPASGMDIRLTLARELLESRDVELLVIGVVEALPRDGHQAFSDIATPGEILTSPWVVNRNLPKNLARLPIRQMQLSFASAFPAAFGYRTAFDPSLYPGATIDSRLFSGWTVEGEARLHANPGHARELAEESARRKGEITPPVLPEYLRWVEFGVSRTYLERIARLADAHDTRLAFVFFPFFQGYREPLEKQWLEERGPLWIADFMMTDPANYNDAAHASASGADQLAVWLSDRIVENLQPASMVPGREEVGR